ncbi:hypothetical protein ANN_23733 [Periplaneta americana]|uniref:Reverse transcriptase domain-containing protein n=1 Tax=Periplaneta americana TaxID=6978 RepID=A0ABQ8SND0_PERAM|nr:hypothetical protein ANN_23733 [Periplaneta americana]
MKIAKIIYLSKNWKNKSGKSNKDKVSSQESTFSERSKSQHSVNTCSMRAAEKRMTDTQPGLPDQIKATEMKFFRRTAGYTLLDRKRNEEILEQLEVESVEEKISRYKFNWLDHVRRMENSRIPKIMIQYKPRGHRRPGRPFRRLLDGAETVEKLLSSSLLSKNLKVIIYKTVILPVVLYGCETWTLILREEQRLRVFEDKVLRKIFGAKRDEVTGEWRKLHNAELYAFYSSPDIIRNIESRRLRWAGHVARMGESRNAYSVSWETGGKKTIGEAETRTSHGNEVDLGGDMWRDYTRQDGPMQSRCGTPKSEREDREDHVSDGLTCLPKRRENNVRG